MPKEKKRRRANAVSLLGAKDEIRTRDPHLGKVMRYQLRYVRIPRWESQTLADTPTLVTPGLGEKSPLTAG